MIKVKIIKPPIPILFLDTNFFIDLVQNRYNPIKSTHYKDELYLVDLITRLTKEKKLLCPQGDQEEEYELGAKYEDEIRGEQVQLSLGIRAMHHYGVQKYQTQIAIRGFIKGDIKLTYDYRSIFLNDPIRELESQLKQRFIVSAHIPTHKILLDKSRKTKRELADEFEKMRQEKAKLKVKYGDWVVHETRGTLDAIITTLKSVLPKKLFAQPFSEEDINGLQELGDLLAYYEHYSGKQASIKDIADFLKSEYYSTIPYIAVQSRLYASMWVQSGRIKESDNFDFHQASQMLPYAVYYLTDSAFKHRITTNPVNLDKKYKVMAFSLKETQDLIKILEKL